MRVPKKVLKLGPEAVQEWRVEVVVELAKAANKPAVIAAQEAVRAVLPKSASVEEVRSLAEAATSVLLEAVELGESRVEAFVDRFVSREDAAPPPPPPVPMVPKKKHPNILADLPPLQPGMRREVHFRTSRPESQGYGKLPVFGNGKKVAFIS